MSIIRYVDVYWAFVLGLNFIALFEAPSGAVLAFLLVNVLLWLWIRSRKSP